jgi:hypothetical protein
MLSNTSFMVFRMVLNKITGCAMKQASELALIVNRGKDLRDLSSPVYTQNQKSPVITAITGLSF